MHTYESEIPQNKCATMNYELEQGLLVSGLIEKY